MKWEKIYFPAILVGIICAVLMWLATYLPVASDNALMGWVPLIVVFVAILPALITLVISKIKVSGWNIFWTIVVQASLIVFVAMKIYPENLGVAELVNYHYLYSCIIGVTSMIVSAMSLSCPNGCKYRL